MGVLLQYFAAISSSLGAFSAGTALGWTSNLQAKIVNGDYGFEIKDFEWALLSSMLNIGAALVCVLVGFTINLIGRRSTMLLLVIPFLLGWGLLIFAINASMLIVGRAFIGLACGGICVSGPVYCGEIAEKSIRGTLGSFFQLLITAGILCVYIFGSYFSAKTTSIVCGIVPIIFGICIFICPESPTFLIMKSREDEAMESLWRFRGSDFDAASEIAELKLEENLRRSQSAKSAFKKKSSRRALFIGFGLMFFQQLSGINAVIFYTSTIFRDASIEIQPELATIFIGVVQVIATFVATLTVDKLGRRLLLLVSDTLMALCTLVLGIYAGIRSVNESAVDGLGWISLLSLSVFIIAFSVGLGPVPWLMVGELFSSDIKGIAGSLTATLNWTLAFVVTISYPPLSQSLGISVCFLIFTVVSIIGVIFTFFIVPETKRKSLNEIQLILSGN